MNNKTITLTQTPLKQRKKNIRNAHTTEPLAICNIIEKIVLMPFSDFMFCHPKEYVSVMEEFTSHKQKWNFPESRQECRRPHVLQQETKRSFGSNF